MLRLFCHLQFACFRQMAATATILTRQAFLCWLTTATLLLIALANPWVQAQESPRLAWNRSRIQGSPELPLPFIAENAYPNLRFQQCIDMAVAPGLNRIFVVQQSGKIYSFEDRPDASNADLDLVVDLAQAIPGVEQVYALVFHPQFATNRFCYVCYIKAAEQPDGTHIARFTLDDSQPPKIDPASEHTILTWLSGGHNGCCLRFGPDGYLYISTGDGAGPNPPDPLRTGQDVTDLLSAILRIDVDQTDGSRNYRIPEDNPMVGIPTARGELWAYGLRNPWRMSFDRKSGDLWVGDVGWEQWEMLYRVEPGSNYGWSITEGRQPTNPDWPPGPTPIMPPTIEHPHTESSSITDGLTYYGRQLDSLYGYHIYGDYDTGKIWGFRFVDGEVTQHRELADTTLRIVSFGEKPDSEFLVLDYAGGTLNRLAPNPKVGAVDDFPRQLSQTGLFESLVPLRPIAGVVPYTIVAPTWNDFGSSVYHAAIPGDQKIQVQDGPWQFPKDTVLAKSISVPMARKQRDDHGSNHAGPIANSPHMVETQLLHFDGVDWQTYSYRWNEANTDAFLVEAAGDERLLDIADPASPDGVRQVNWRFASRSECQRCHNKWAGPPLAFNALQLDTNHTTGSATVGQLESLVQQAVLDRIPSPTHLRQLVDPRDANAELDLRARSYLHTHCSHCHQMHAGSGALAQMQLDVPIDKMAMVSVKPTLGNFGIESARIVAPSDPLRSILLARMVKSGTGHMPIIGPSEVDMAGCKLIYDWIAAMPIDASDATSFAAQGKLPKEMLQITSALQNLKRAKSESEFRRALESCTSSPSRAMALALQLDNGLHNATWQAAFNQSVSELTEPTIRDFLERYVPLRNRIKRTGVNVVEDQILQIEGDVDRGRKVFFETDGVQCKNCHRVDGQGIEIGPDLSKIGEKYTARQILRSIVEPSKTIEPKYVTYLIETRDGRAIAGVVIRREEERILLRDAMNNLYDIESEDIVQIVAKQQSIMPEQLLRDLTAEQISDLIAYLASRK